MTRPSEALGRSGRFGTQLMLKRGRHVVCVGGGSSFHGVIGQIGYEEHAVFGLPDVLDIEGVWVGTMPDRFEPRDGDHFATGRVGRAR